MVKNSLTKKDNNSSFSAYLTQSAVKEHIHKVIGGKDGDKFITSIISAVNQNSALKECTNQTIVGAALIGQSLNLSPSPQLGQFYMVPFKNNKKGVTEAQFQIGYKGMIQLAIRSGEYKKLNVLPIKEGELIKYDPLNEEIEVSLIEDEEIREKAETSGYYCMFELVNGFKKAMYWSKKKMESHALKYSKGYAAKKGYTFWEKDFDAMACKTMLRQLISKYGIMSIDFQKAYENDMAVIDEKGNTKYVDDVENEEQSVVDAEYKEVKEEHPAENSAAAALFGGI